MMFLVIFMKDLFLRSIFPLTFPRSPRAKSQNGKKNPLSMGRGYTQQLTKLVDLQQLHQSCYQIDFTDLECKTDQKCRFQVKVTSSQGSLAKYRELTGTVAGSRDNHPFLVGCCPSTWTSHNWANMIRPCGGGHSILITIQSKRTQALVCFHSHIALNRHVSTYTLYILQM